MITLRKATDRFHTQIDWLDSWHTFSFGHHYDPRHMGYGPLRVINDDRIAGGGGFGTHPHRDMEIITVVLEGALQHKDSLGTGSVILPGDVQKMSAGTGIKHSEFNADAHTPVHLLQIWIMPDKEGVDPEYQQIHFAPERLQDQLCLVAGPKGSKGDIISLYQDAHMYVAKLAAGKTLEYTPPQGRKTWVQVATGDAEISGTPVKGGDGVAAEGEAKLGFKAKQDSTLIVFDLGD
jgi:redox-sensitive bicupin YhaK (pirin superfamily)